MIQRTVSVLGLLGLIAFFTPASAQSVTAIPAYLRPEVAAALQRVSPDSISAVMRILASDQFEGRQPGTRGFAMASDYVQNKMKAMGLRPGVSGNSYVQPVLLRKGKVSTAGSSLSLGSDPLVYGQDFLVHPCFYRPVSAVTAPLVFAGYGVYAPELHYDDYGSTNVKGCIVVFLDAAPAIFPSNERAYFSSAATKYAEAVKRGAAGVISLSSTGSLTGWEAMTKRAGQGAYRWAEANGDLQPDFPELKVIATLSPTRAAALFTGSGHDWQEIADKAKAGQPQSFPLNK